MKLLFVRSARSIWLLPFTYLNPRGKALGPAVGALVARYQFAKSPDQASLADAKSLKFEQGVFVGAGGVPITVGLTVHGDGFIAETQSSTDDSDAFLDDALTWVSESFDLPKHTDFPVKRLHASDVYVEMDSDLRVFSEQFMRFFEDLAYTLDPEGKKPMGLINFTLGNDPASERPMTFRLEREAGSPMSMNHYYSYAPTGTESHLLLLERLESFAK